MCPMHKNSSAWRSVVAGVFTEAAFFATDRGHRDRASRHNSSGTRMNRTWYVTFEVPRSGTLVRRRNPRLTSTFETEAEAREFARTKFEGGLIVTAGTINPHVPRRAIPSASIPAWLELGQNSEPTDQEGAQDQAGSPAPVTKTS